MLIDNVFDNRKSQTTAFDFVRMAHVGTVEPFKHAFLLVFRNADARVGNREDGARARALPDDPDSVFFINQYCVKLIFNRL